MTDHAGNEKPNEAERLAFTSTDNEKLIEEAAKAMYEATVEEWTYGDLARAALGVFEKAHTPTDDERSAQFVTDADLARFEATAEPIYRSTFEAGKASKYLVSTLGQWVIRLVAEVRRLRHTEVLEPSIDGTPRDFQAYELTVDMLEDLLVTAGISASEHGIAIRKTASALVYKIGRHLAQEPEVLEPSAEAVIGDEREALIDVMVMTKLSDYATTDMSAIHQAVDAILKSEVWRFRRTEVPEPSAEEWAARVHAAREKAIAKGYTPEHDAKHGVRHLLRWAIDYARRGRPEDSSGLVAAAIDLADIAYAELERLRHVADTMSAVSEGLRTRYAGDSQAAYFMRQIDEALAALPEPQGEPSDALCGDWPAPCNCDDPTTHDGSVPASLVQSEQGEPSDAQRTEIEARVLEGFLGKLAGDGAYTLDFSSAMRLHDHIVRLLKRDIAALRADGGLR